MGDRANVVVLMSGDSPPVNLYSHWDGQDFLDVAKKAVRAGAEDRYFLLVLIEKLVQAGNLSGVGTFLAPDNEHDILFVDSETGQCISGPKKFGVNYTSSALRRSIVFDRKTKHKFDDRFVAKRLVRIAKPNPATAVVLLEDECRPVYLYSHGGGARFHVAIRAALAYTGKDLDGVTCASRLGDGDYFLRGLIGHLFKFSHGVLTSVGTSFCNDSREDVLVIDSDTGHAFEVSAEKCAAFGGRTSKAHRDGMCSRKEATTKQSNRA